MRNRQKELPLINSSVKLLIQEILSYASFTTDEVACYFITNKEMCAMHDKFFNDPSPTDCISFPLDGQEKSSTGYHVLGEIFVCPKAALLYKPHSPYEELSLYVVHGLLHLLGYDDIEPAMRKKMRAAEKKQMNNLKIKNLLLKAP